MVSAPEAPAPRAANGEGRITFDVPEIPGSVLGMGGLRILPTWYADGKEQRPDPLPWAELDKLRRDPVIATALRYLTAPILSRVRQATIESDDPAVRAFVHQALIETGVLYQCVQSALSAYVWGTAIHEKVWTVQDLTVEYEAPDPETGELVPATAWDGLARVYKEIVLVNPASVEHIKRRTTDTDAGPGDGSFDGFVQRSPIAGRGDADVEAAAAWVYPWASEFGGLWGRPRIRDAYPYWYWTQILLKLYVAWAERKAAPTRVMRYPPGRNPTTGEDNAVVAARLAAAIDMLTSVAVPSTPDGGTDAWRFEEAGTQDRTDTFERPLKMMRLLMLLAVGIPERVFGDEARGTYGSIAAQTDTYLLTLDGDMAPLVDSLNRYVLAPLVEQNYGGDAAPARVRVPGLTDEERALMLDLLNKLVTSPVLSDTIDGRALLERFSIPVKEETDQADPMGDLLGDGEDLPEDVPAELDTADLAAEPPDNLILSDWDLAEMLIEFADVLALADKVNPSDYSVTPDSSSLLGFRVVSRSTGKRLSGFAAKQVIKSIQAASRAKAKAGKAKAAGAKKAASAKAKADKSAERAAKKAENEQKRAQKKAETEQKRAEKKAQVAQDKTDRETKQAAKGERDALEKKTGNLDADLAAQAIKRAGWDLDGDPVASKDDAIGQAEALAANSPEAVVSVIKTGGGYQVVTKPKEKIKRPKASGKNVALADDDPGYDGAALNDQARAVFDEAAARLAALLTEDGDGA